MAHLPPCEASIFAYSSGFILYLYRLCLLMKEGSEATFFAYFSRALRFSSFRYSGSDIRW